MQATAREYENSPLPWRDSAIRFECGSCQHTAAIADPTTITTSILSALLTIAVLIYAVVNGFLLFISEQFSSSISWILFAIFLSVVFLGFSVGALLNLFSGIRDIRQRVRYPMTMSQGSPHQIILTLTLGALPWGIAIGFGFLNDLFLNNVEWIAYLLLPIIFAPILLASKLKLSPVSVFLACIFWGAIGGFIAWLA